MGSKITDCFLITKTFRKEFSNNLLKPVLILSGDNLIDAISTLSSAASNAL